MKMKKGWAGCGKHCIVIIWKLKLCGIVLVFVLCVQLDELMIAPTAPNSDRTNPVCGVQNHHFTNFAIVDDVFRLAAHSVLNL